MSERCYLLPRLRSDTLGPDVTPGSIHDYWPDPEHAYAGFIEPEVVVVWRGRVVWRRKVERAATGIRPAGTYIERSVAAQRVAAELNTPGVPRERQREALGL